MRRLLSALLILLLFLPVCGFAGELETKTYTVAASFYPVYVLLRNITEGVEAVQAVSLTAPSTGCLHDYQLLAGDMRVLDGADAFVINGAGMESFLDTLEASFPGLPVVDSSIGIELMESVSGETEYNPHIWLTPLNSAQMALNIAQGLSDIFPQYAEIFSENARLYGEKMEALHSEIMEASQSWVRKKIVTFHEAFPYFAKAYRLEVVAVVALEPDEGISPLYLTELVNAVRENENPPLFTEPQYSNDAARTVSLETGAPVFELDPLVTGDGEADSYLVGMRKNLETLSIALSESN